MDDRLTQALERIQEALGLLDDMNAQVPAAWLQLALDMLEREYLPVAFGPAMARQTVRQ